MHAIRVARPCAERQPVERMRDGAVVLRLGFGIQHCRRRSRGSTGTVRDWRGTAAKTTAMSKPVKRVRDPWLSGWTESRRPEVVFGLRVSASGLGFGFWDLASIYATGWSLSGGQIHVADVFLDHPPRAEAGQHGADRLLDDLQPAVRNAVARRGRRTSGTTCCSSSV